MTVILNTRNNSKRQFSSTLLIDGNPIVFLFLLTELEYKFNHLLCLVFRFLSLAYKDGPSMISIDDDTMMASVIDLGPSLTKSLQQTDILYHEPLSKLATNTLNKTNEHCRSLLNLLPTSFRPRHYRQALSKKCTDAVSSNKKKPMKKFIYCVIECHFIHLSLVTCSCTSLTVDRTKKNWLFFLLFLYIFHAM